MIGTGAVGAGPTGALIGTGFRSAIASAGSPWWTHGTLLDTPANTLMHASWRTGALVDAAGNTWTSVGTPTVLAGSGNFPPAASMLDGSNHYELPAASNPLDAAGYLGVAILKPSAWDVANTSMILSMFNATATKGYQLVANETSQVRWMATPSNTKLDTAMTAGAPYVICFGNDPAVGYSYLKVNRRAMIAPGGGGISSFDGTEIAKIGTHYDNLLGFRGSLYELWVGQPSAYLYPGASWGITGVNNYFTSLVNTVFARLGTSPL